VNTLMTGRLAELVLHPTVKPVAMIADAIKDVSRRGGIVLDLFGGSGSTVIAAHKTGRRARVCELDPVYCDRILHRWEIFAKDDAELIACGLGSRRVNDDPLGARGDRSGSPPSAPRPEDGLARGQRPAAQSPVAPKRLLARATLAPARLCRGLV
jgi:DNA methylase